MIFSTALINARRVASTLAVALTVILASASRTAAADSSAPPGGTIAYALVSLHWATYQTADSKAECPQGFNEGPREQFKILFPDNGVKRTLMETQIKREIDGWFPSAEPDQFPFREAGGRTAIGMNLDGKTGANDFTSPDGEPGIDNQLYRALGCILSYRGPQGPNDYFDNEAIAKDRYNRTLIELTGVDSLINDDDVGVTVYRGLDPLLTDATGNNIMPGGSERIDTRWGAKFIQHFRGRITAGVLTTAPADFVFPWSTFELPTDQYIRAMRMRVKVAPDGAEGLIGGYADVETWYRQTMKSESTHHQSYGQLSPPSLYKALRRLADAFPDPATGVNTAISSALRAKFTQVFILPPPAQTASH